MPMNLFSCLYAFLYIMIFLYHATNIVMGVIFILILSYVCHLLIFSPPSMYKGRGDKVAVFNLFMHQCQLYVTYRWFAQSCSNHLLIFISHACCTWLVYCLLSLIFPANFPLSSTSWVTWLSSTFPSLLGESELWPNNVSLVMFTEHCLLGQGSSLGMAWVKMSCKLPDNFWSVQIGIPLMLYWCCINVKSSTWWPCQFLSFVWYSSVLPGDYCWAWPSNPVCMNLHLLAGLLL